MRQMKPEVAFPRPDTGRAMGDVDVAGVYRLFEQVMAVGDRLPAPARGAAGRKALAGRIFREAPLLVTRVARVLGTRGELFDDVPIDAGAMVRRQERALAWECLQNALLWLARWAGELYVVDQAGAVEDAMAAIAQARGDAGRPFPHPRSEERRRALLQAEQVLAARQARKRRKAARTRKKGAGEAPLGSR